ncbi:MAG: aldo/keto reductase, partial [Chloroflexota bacterium]|nr:aldo/keto reductase [Chloroflexota bacterium]
AMTPDTKFGGDDWRRSGMAFGLPLFKEENFQRNLQVVERLKEIAKKKRKAVAQLAVAWVLSNPAVSVALTGIRRQEVIEENVGAASWKLTAREKQEIEEAFKVG